MEKIKLYRGIAVGYKDADKVINDIINNGLDLSENANWGCFIWKDQVNTNELILKEDLLRKDTEIMSKFVKTRSGERREYLEGYKGICFADLDGATYYAQKHNKIQDKQVPILIEVNVDLSSIAIDGRDYLYTVFSLLRSLSENKLSVIKNDLLLVYGSQIQKYFEKVFLHPKSDTNAICDLIICDEEIKKSHLKNNHIIQGRYGTLFKSAFFVKMPLEKENVISVKILESDFVIPISQINISNVR